MDSKHCVYVGGMFLPTEPLNEIRNTNFYKQLCCLYELYGNTDES